MAAMPPLPPGAVLATAPPKPITPPPLPAGAVLASHPNAPPLPAGATVAAVPQVSRETVGQSVAGEAKALGQSVLNIPRDMARRSNQAVEDIKGDFTAPVQGAPKKGVGNYIVRDVGSLGREKPGVMDYAARAGKTALDVANYGSGMAAASGVGDAVLGRPVEKMTGGKVKKETVGDIAAMVVPFGGNIARAVKGAALPAGVKDAAAAVEKIFSPTTISPAAGATEKIIRRTAAQGSLEAEKAASKLVEDNHVVANLPVAEQRALVHYIENRSKGMKLANPALQGTADKIAEVYDTYRNRVQKILPVSATPKFLDDYYVHMWKENPTIVKDKIGAFSKQGSGRNLKQRTIPTIAEGIKAGLTPVTENPIEATAAYAQNMSRFLATHDMQNELKAQGYAKWFSPGSTNIPAGWKPMDGILTEKVAPVSVGTAKAAVGPTGATLAKGRPIKLYAPPDVARVYNNFISKGFEQGDAGAIFSGARSAANAMTQLKLGLSTFHLATMANEAVTSGFARAYKAMSRGDLPTAGKAFSTAVARPVLDYRRGMKMQRELLDKAMPDSMSAKVNDAFVRSGGRLKMDPFYRTRASGSFFNAWEKGTLKRELKEAAEKMYKGTPYETAKGVVDNAANIIQTTAAPLFEKYIPAVKRGAFASSMEDFLKANPKATQAELDDYSVKLSDSIDNRFGELVQDNLFWKKQLKQMTQMLLLSPTWNLGTVREIGGGLKDALGAGADISKGKGISDRTAYVAGLATQVALMNAVYTYLKTGTAPEGKDFMAGRTGGQDLGSGNPERVQMPGYQKDVYAFGYDFPHHITEEAVNKLNPALSTAIQIWRNQDFRGLPIYRPHGAQAQADEPGLPDYLMEQLLPISIGQMSAGSKKGSNIGAVEKGLLADRPAPQYITAPSRLQAIEGRAATKDWQSRIRADKKQKANLK